MRIKISRLSGTSNEERASSMRSAWIRRAKSGTRTLTKMDKLEYRGQCSALETTASIIDMGGVGNIGMQPSLPVTLPDQPFGADLQDNGVLYHTIK